MQRCSKLAGGKPTTQRPVGLPVADHVTWSKEGPGLRIAFFLDDGVFASATFLPLDEAQVTRVLYYQPRSLARLLVDFKGEISLVDPFPDSDVVGPKDPWFAEP